MLAFRSLPRAGIFVNIALCISVILLVTIDSHNWPILITGKVPKIYIFYDFSSINSLYILCFRQAISISPDNGQPYNQLALLRAARGDKLGAAYYYARSLAVEGPFLPASNNLSQTLASTSELLKWVKFAGTFLFHNYINIFGWTYGDESSSSYPLHS